MATERAPPRLEAIVLAAGAGSRFGGGKLTASWRGGRLIDGALAAAFAAHVERVIVVTGADEGVADAALDFTRRDERAGQQRLTVVHAADHALGMSASLKAGIAGLVEDAEGVFVFLGDMPMIPADTVETMIVRLANGAVAVAPTWRGRRGHPVLFGRSLFPVLARSKGDEGAREVLRDLGDRLSLVPASSPGVLLDVDAPGDLDALE